MNIFRLIAEHGFVRNLNYKYIYGRRVFGGFKVQRIQDEFDWCTWLIVKPESEI